MLLNLDHVTASKTYVAADFPSDAPLYILVSPSAAVTLTFPAPTTFDLAQNQAKLLAYVRVDTANHAVAITASPDGSPSLVRVRSQPGTSGWDANTSPVYVGASLALSVKAVVTVSIDGRVPNLTYVDGVVRVAA